MGSLKDANNGDESKVSLLKEGSVVSDCSEFSLEKKLWVLA